jgi:hypothetical protein
MLPFLVLQVGRAISGKHIGGRIFDSSSAHGLGGETILALGFLISSFAHPRKIIRTIKNKEGPLIAYL